MYRVYATAENGEGRVLLLGDYADVGDIEIIVGVFREDVVITIEEVNKEREL